MRKATVLTIALLLLAACGGGLESTNVINPPPVQAQNPVQGAILYGFCQAPSQGGGTVWILGLGTAKDCSGGTSTMPLGGVVLTSSGKLLSLRFKANTAVALTVYVNGSPTALSCPIPAGSTSCGSIGNITVFDGDEVAIGVTPAGAGAFSNIRVSVEKQ